MPTQEEMEIRIRYQLYKQKMNLPQLLLDRKGTGGR